MLTMILKIVSKTFSLIALFILPLATIGNAQAQQSPKNPQELAGLHTARLNLGQEALYLGLGKFAAKIQDLGLNLSRTNADYSYSLLPSRTSTLQYAIARRRNLKSYVGRVYVIRHSNGEATTTAIVCENNRFGSHRPATPLIDTNLQLICAPGTTKRQPHAAVTWEEWNARGKSIVGSMNRGQQAYLMETEKFATHITALGLTALGLGLDGDNPGYEVSIQASDRFTYQYVISRQDNVKSYVGAVVIGLHSSGESTTIAVVCENIAPGRSRPAAPIIRGEGMAPICAPGTQAVQWQ
jgi:hypothetical protein